MRRAQSAACSFEVKPPVAVRVPSPLLEYANDSNCGTWTAFECVCNVLSLPRVSFEVHPIVVVHHVAVRAAGLALVELVSKKEPWPMFQRPVKLRKALHAQVRGVRCCLEAIFLLNRE